MGAQNVVVDINGRTAASNSLYQELTKGLGYVNWIIQVRSIVNALGMPMSDALEKMDTSIPQNTQAAQFGHQTVGGFITGSKDKLGLAKDWNEWTSQVKALRLKDTYNISSENPQEVINQFNDISKSLGRHPATTTEYHQTKDSILTKQRQEADQRHKMQTAEMNERITDLMKRVEIEQRNSAQQSHKTADLEARLDSTLREMNLRLTEAQRNHDTEMERKLLAQRSDLISSTQQQVEEMRLSADMRVKEAQERLDEMQSYYRENFVSKEDHEIISQQLIKERETTYEQMRQLNQVNRSLDDALNQLSEEQRLHASEKDRVSTLTRQVDQLNTRMNTIARAPFMGESSELTAQLQEQIDELTLTLSNSTTENAGLVQREKILIRKLESIRKQLVSLRKENGILSTRLASVSARLKKAKASIKVKTREIASTKSALTAIGLLLGASLLTSVALIAIH